MFEVEKVNVAPGEHGVLLPALPLLDRADGEAQLGRSKASRIVLFWRRMYISTLLEVNTQQWQTWGCRGH